jgi:hypothetical protein
MFFNTFAEAASSPEPSGRKKQQKLNGFLCFLGVADFSLEPLLAGPCPY